MDDSQPTNPPTNQVVLNQQVNTTSSQQLQQQQQQLEQECNVFETKRDCCLCLLLLGGYYAGVILAMYVCGTRGNFFFTLLMFFFLLFPLGLKICWRKFSKWQARKDVLQQNAVQFERLSVRGTEQQSTGQGTASQAHHEIVGGSRNNESLVTLGGPYIPGRNVNPEIGFSDTGMGLSAAPSYSPTCSTQPPPSYDEVIRLYGHPRVEERDTQPQDQGQHNPGQQELQQPEQSQLGERQQQPGPYPEEPPPQYSLSENGVR